MEISLCFIILGNSNGTLLEHMRMYPHLRRTKQNAFWEVVVLILDHSTAGSISSLSSRSDHWRSDFIALP